MTRLFAKYRALVRERPLRTALLAVVVVFTIALGISFGLSRQRTANLKRLRIGDSRAQVLNLLGSPSTVLTNGYSFGIFSDHREQWCYGGPVTPRYPFVRLRIFGGNDDELIVYFSDGKVAEVSDPNVPKSSLK